jgi:penicillin-binding protein 1A
MSPLEVATGYAIIANGGYRVEPYLIDRIEDLEGNIIFQAKPPTVCRDCDTPTVSAELSMEQILSGDSHLPDLPPAPRVMDERVNFIIDSILKDVITRGTATKARALERSDIAGKTGTTNGPMDAWFSGYNQDVVTTTWVGFDNYTPLGRREFGGTAALPIWISYMREALANSPERKRALPTGIVNVRIDPDTGLLASEGQRNAIFEFFREENVPSQNSQGNGNSSSQQLIEDLETSIF